MQNILDKRFAYLINNFDMDNMHNYCNIKNALVSIKDINTVEIKFFKVFENNKEIVSIIKKSFIKGLNQDMINKIVSYIPVYNYVKVVLNIDYPNDYPFKPPLWSLNNYTTNITNKKTNIENHLINVIRSHNSIYFRDWSPAIHIVPDLLSIFSKFDKMDEYIF